MRLISRASLAFKRQKPADKTTFGANVTTALQNAVAQFPNLPITITDLQALTANLAAAIVAALTGNHIAVATLKVAIADWNSGFTLTANYVTSVAQGDETIIRSAGFVPTKSETQPTQKPGPANGFNATINGSRGSIIAGCKNAVTDAIAYLYTAVPDDVTVSYNGDTMVIAVGEKTIYINADTHKQTEFCHLPSGVGFNVSMFAINRAGSGPAATSKKSNTAIDLQPLKNCFQILISKPAFAGFFVCNNIVMYFLSFLSN